MRLQTIPLLTLIPSSYALIPRDSICTASSHSSPQQDDTPSITNALKQCGNGGRIILPVNQTFTLHTALDLSLCRSCDFQINGLISLHPNWSYWSTQPAAILIRNSTVLLIRTDSETGFYTPGAIDAQNFGWDGKSGSAGQVPALFDITDGSYQVHIRDLRIHRVPGTVFSVRDGANAVRIYGVEVMTPAREGLRVERARHVYLWNDTLRAQEACVRVLNGSSNVQVEDTNCFAEARAGVVPRGVEIRLGGTGRNGLEWVRNVFVKRFKAVGGMDLVAFLANGLRGKSAEIFNATFTDVEIGGLARRAVVLEQGDTVRLNTTAVLFRGWEGKAEKEEKLKCKNKDDVCDFRSENWNVVYGK